MATRRRYVFSTADAVRYRFPTHVNDLVMDRAEAETSEAFIVVLDPGEAPPRHVHHDMEQIFYMLEGTGVLEIGETPEAHAVQAGDVVRVPPHTVHRVVCTGARPVRYLSIDAFVGGRPAAEPTWDSHVRILCAAFGWEFDQVKSGVTTSTGRGGETQISGPRSRLDAEHDPHAGQAERRRPYER